MMLFNPKQPLLRRKDFATYINIVGIIKEKDAAMNDNKILDTLIVNQRIEEDWLRSVGVRRKRLPKKMAEAVATRVFLTSMPIEVLRSLKVSNDNADR